MKIAYIIGYYGHHNFGDEIMLDILVHQLRTSGYSSIYFESGDVPRDIGAIPVGYKRLNARQWPKILRGIVNFNRDLQISLRKILAADLVVFGGGSLLSDSTSVITLLKILIKLRYAKIHRSRIVSVGLGVGMLKSTVRRKLVTYILRQIELVAARDELSVKSLAHCDPSQVSKIELSSDLFYLLDAPKQQKNTDYKGVVGVTVAPPYLEDYITPEKFAISINDILSKIPLETKKVNLLVFQKHSDKRYCDLSYFQVIERSLNYPVEIIECPIDISSALEIMSKLDFVVGMRYHSLVMASLLNIPFIGIGVEKKISSLASEFHAPNFSIEQLKDATFHDYFPLKQLPTYESLAKLAHRAEIYKQILK